MAKQTKYNVDIEVKNVNTGVEATISDTAINNGQYSTTELASIQNGGGTVNVKASGDAGVKGQFNVSFPGHGHYTVTFSVSADGQPCLEVEDHTTPQRLISSQYDPPKMVDNTLVANVKFVIFVG